MSVRDPVVLGHFWALTGADPQPRKRAAGLLAAHAAGCQRSFALGGAAPGENGRSQSDKTDISPVLAYTLRRLVRGLSSPREGARQGCALALGELLRLVHETSAFDRTRVPTEATMVGVWASLVREAESGGVRVVKHSVFAGEGAISHGVGTAGYAWTQGEEMESLGQQKAGRATPQQVRDTCFALVFGALAIVRAGIYPSASSSESSLSNGSVTDDLVDDARRAEEGPLAADMARVLLSVSSAKFYLGDAAFDVLVQLCARLPSDAFREHILSVISTRYSQFPISDLLPEHVALYIRLHRLYPQVVPDLGALFRRISGPSRNLRSDAGLALVSAAMASSTRSHPHRHSAWVPLIEYFCCLPATEAETLQFWKAVVDDGLMAGRYEARALGFALFCDLATAASTHHVAGRVLSETPHALTSLPFPLERLPILLTPRFLRTMVNHLSGADHYLHKSAELVQKSLLGAVRVPVGVGDQPSAASISIQQQVRVAFAMQLMTSHRNFDALTKTGTVKHLLAGMSALAASSYSTHLYMQFARPSFAAPLPDIDGDRAEEEDEEENVGFSAIERDPEAAARTERVWALNQLYSLTRHRNHMSTSAEADAPAVEKWLEETLLFFMFNAFFVVHEGKNGLSSLQRRMFVTDSALTKDVRDVSLLRFFSLLNDLNSHTNGARLDGVSWLRFANLSFLSFSSTKGVSALPSAKFGDADVMRARAAVSATHDRLLTTLTSSNRLSGSKNRLVESQKSSMSGLLYNVQWHLVHPESRDAETLEIISDLLQVAEQVFATSAKKSNSKPSKRKSSGGDDDDAANDSEEDDDDVTVFVDALLALLDRPSSFLRSAVQHAFSAFAPDLTAPAVRALTDSLMPSALETVTNDNDSGGDDSEVDDISSDDESSSPIPVASVKHRKQNVIKMVESVDDDDDDDDESSVSSADDEQMMRMDSALASVLRNMKQKRLSKTNQQQRETQFRFKVLDLIDVATKRLTSGPDVTNAMLELCYEMADQLLVALRRHANTAQTQAAGHFAQRILDLLQKRIFRAPGASELSAACVQALHQRLAQTLSKDLWRRSCGRQPLVVKALVGTVNFYLRVLRHANCLNDDSVSMEVHGAITRIFSSHSASHVKPQFLSELFERQPWLGWRHASTVSEACVAARTDWLKLGGLKVLATVARTTKPSLTANVLTVQGQVQGLADAIAEALSAATASRSQPAEPVESEGSPVWNAKRVKEALQSANASVTAIKRGLAASSFSVPDFARLRAVVEQISVDSTSQAKSKPLQSLIATLLRATDVAAGASPAKSPAAKKRSTAEPKPSSDKIAHEVHSKRPSKRRKSGEH